MLTGDSKDTAVAIAKELGMWDSSSTAISGQEVENSSESQLASHLASVRVFYRMTPLYKMKIVQAFRSLGNVVAMTGDGVNDGNLVSFLSFVRLPLTFFLSFEFLHVAPALKQSDIGIAMGRGSDVAKESSQIILADSNFATIVAAVEEGKAIFGNIRNFLRFQLSTSVAALSIIAYCTLFGHPLPLNPMQILWINIIMDGPPAQSLGVEPRPADAINAPPQNPNLPVIDRQMMVKIALGALTMLVGTLYAFFSIETDGVDEEQPHRASSVAFTTFVLFQMFNAFNCRSSTHSVFEIGLGTNRYLLLAVALSLLGQALVLYVPLLQYVFESAPLSLSDLLFCCAVSSSIFVMDELWKRFAAYTSMERLLRTRHTLA
jgi:Ca2+-transporting ATPase